MSCDSDSHDDDHVCPAAPDGRHKPYPASICPADGMEDWVIIVWCALCGRSASLRIDPSELQW